MKHVTETQVNWDNLQAFRTFGGPGLFLLLIFDTFKMLAQKEKSV